MIGVYGEKGQDGASGSDGAPGSDGQDGVSITGVTTHYLASSASTGVTIGTSGWTEAVQTTDTTKKYLWSYQEISYSDLEVTTTTPVIIGTHGEAGPQGPQGNQGPQGVRGPGVVFRGEFSTDSTDDNNYYYNDNDRVDVVLYQSNYYYYKGATGTVSSWNSTH